MLTLQAAASLPGHWLGLIAGIALVVSNVRAGRPAWRFRHPEHVVGLLGLALLIDGRLVGLFLSPPERMMGDVVRIMYVHVPSAIVSMLVFTACFAAALGFLFTDRPALDLVVEATAEVGVVLALLLQLTGGIFARPTWGVYWDWDPRLVSTAVMMLSFLAVLTLRRTVDDPDRRATWTSVGVVLSWSSLVVTYFSVRWWRSIHQMQSNTSTIGPELRLVLDLNVVGLLCVAAWLVVRRWRIAVHRALAEAAPPLPPAEVGA